MKEMDPKEKKQGWKETVMLYLHDAVYLLTTVLLVLMLVFRIIVVSGDSMKMTLLDGDYLVLLSNLFYQNPQQGDVVVISKDAFEDGAPIVKRVIATEGQTVDINFETGDLYIDGHILQESYINNLTLSTWGTQFPLVVEENCIFALGDNRAVSRDSRDPIIGQIDRREVLGKALFLFFPGSDHDLADRDFDRIGVIQ